MKAPVVVVAALVVTGLAAAASAQPASDGRPAGFSIGIGLGYEVPAELQAPDVAGVRFRLPGGLTFEPQVVAVRSASTFDPGGGGASTESGNLGLAAGVDVRWPRRIRGPVDLVLAADVVAGHARTDPDGDDDETATSAIGLRWGFGLEYWIRARWCISLTAMNPLVVALSETEAQGPDVSSTQTITVVGLVFDPRVTVMLHLFL